MPSVVMSEAKKSLLDSQSFVIAAPEMMNAPKPQSVKKTLIIAGTGVVTVALLLTAILVGMRLLTESHKNILMFSQHLDHTIKQEFLTEEDDSNIEQYQTQEGNDGTVIIQDSNRDVQVVKITSSDSASCYVIPMTRNAAGETSKFPNKQLISNNETMKYTASTTGIHDTSFLSKTVRNVCTGVPTFWATPTCDKETGVKGPDNKICCRAICSCCPRRCRVICRTC